MPAAAPNSHVWHATAVDFDGQGLLIVGASGTGKSSLALELVLRGATLIADDKTRLSASASGIWLDRPKTLPPWLEARGVGLLKPPLSPEPVLAALVIDLDKEETARLPPRRTLDLLGYTLPLLHKVSGPYFPSSVLAYLFYGTAHPD